MPWATVAANVQLPLALAGVGPAERAARAQAALERVDLGGRTHAMPRQLSGGMRMRVSIARALVTNPDLLLMDEPFGALDEITRNRLDEDLSMLAMERRLTVLFVTHSIYESVFLASRVVVMAAAPGRIFAEYAIDEPQPRDEAFRLSDRFAVHCRALFSLLKAASAASQGVGGSGGA